LLHLHAEIHRVSRKAIGPPEHSLYLKIKPGC
jgi:hypothetical protein